MASEERVKGKGKALLEGVEESLLRWRAFIARRSHRRTTRALTDSYVIYDSVFEGLAGDLDALATRHPFEVRFPRSIMQAHFDQIRTLDHLAPSVDAADYHAAVQSVQEAIRRDLHPKLNLKGSSGSYFVHDPDHHVVGIFKPKDEEVSFPFLLRSTRH
jgi:hypothetical protein